jgi:hypothetical protein
MYNPDYGFIQQGWECPKCHRIYSPTQSFCLYCNDKRVTYSSTTKPEWMHTDSIYDNEWWKTATNMPAWEDMLRKTGLLEDD